MPILQVESMKSIDEMKDIAATDGVEVALIGFIDLSIYLGMYGSTSIRRLLKQRNQVVNVCEPTSPPIAVGIHARNLDDLFYWRDLSILC